MQISIDWLNDHGACHSGRMWFAETFPPSAAEPVRSVELGLVLRALLKRAVTEPGAGSSVYGWPCWLMDAVDTDALRSVLPEHVVRGTHRGWWVQAKYWCMNGTPGPLNRLDELINKFKAAVSA